ncbi:B12-binding domain-containing radical SAM protein [Terasakiella pusilla]|uniref:B12-binding domain-containing radical SAM protein n=1 Tax=Terasakiella pusilla TaxID=64973 RepID=UPI003AA7F8A4
MIHDTPLDLLLVNPGGRDKIYQNLGTELTAVEPPLWCRLIAGYARDKGLNVSILDSEAENMGAHSAAQEVARLKPRLVGLVVFGHQPSASTQQMVSARAVSQAIKDESINQQIIMVGGHVSALPERTLEEEPIDFACKGEGPLTIVQLLAELEKERPDFEKVESLVWRKGNEICVNPMATLLTDLDTDLHGNVWDLLPMDKYRAHNWQCFGKLETRMPYASIYTTLGCPYKCSFCCINAPFDSNRYRMRSPEKVVDEIELLHRKYGVTVFKIIDEMFVLKERHYMDICKGIIDRGLTGLNIWAYARVDTVKESTLKVMRDAGIQWLALGIESGSKHVRDGAEKALKHDDIVRVVHSIQRAGIRVIGNYIFGLPDDDLDTMQETLDLAMELNCEFANFYSAMAYPGSQLYQQAQTEGWELPTEWSGYSQHSYDCTPLPTEKITAAQVLAFRDKAFDTYFANKRYLDMVTQVFGQETRDHIIEMARHSLKRQLLENGA